MVRANQRLQTRQEPLEDWISAPQTAQGELELVGLEAHHHPLAWQTEKPVRLLRNVMRLTAPNPGVMTGPGTNSYLVGQTSTGFIVIDPGPEDPDHLKRLFAAAQGDIRMIVCTHSHPDHSPGARPLQALCKAASIELARPIPPVLGLPSAPTARAASAFTPDRSLLNQELLRLEGKGENAYISHNLRVIHSPGHAANHLCLVLQEDGLLFSGDHILNGSTTVVDPPDGNMTHYLESLDRLSAACDSDTIDFILPAHGYVLGHAKKAIGLLKAHRLQREEKIRHVMLSQPQGTLDDWLRQAYDDVPERIWPVAKRSLLAHVQRLESLSRQTGLAGNVSPPPHS